MGIAETIIEVMDRGLKPVILDELINEIENQYLSAKKAKEILDWKARYTLEECLRRTMEWYKKFFNEEVNKQ